MGKQKKILTGIVESYLNLDADIFQNKNAQTFNKSMMKILFKRSLNKTDLIRRLVNDVVLSDEQIIEIIRLCLKKESE